MFQLKPSEKPDFCPTLVRDPVYLRPAAAHDHPAWAALREKSRAHLIEWEEDWSPDDLGFTAYRRRIRIFEREARRASGLSLFVFLRDGAEVIGGVTLTNIRYGAARAGMLGYWIGAPHTGCGYGTAAVKAITDHVFGALNLNRIEAACQPENAASRKLLQKCGFRREGFAEDYLRINGAWRDHELYALTARDHQNRQRPGG